MSLPQFQKYILTFIVPGSQQSFKEYQKFVKDFISKATQEEDNKIVQSQIHESDDSNSQPNRNIEQHTILVDKETQHIVFVLDFQEIPSTYSGDVIRKQSQYLYAVIQEKFFQYKKQARINIIGVDTGVLVSYIAIQEQKFPINQIVNMISIFNQDPEELLQTYSMKPQNYMDEATTDVSFQMKQNIMHLIIKNCDVSIGQEKSKKFIDYYEGHIKHFVELSSSQIQNFTKCIPSGQNIIDQNTLSNYLTDIMLLGSLKDSRNTFKRKQIIQDILVADHNSYIKEIDTKKVNLNYQESEKLRVQL
eukprot:403344823